MAFLPLKLREQRIRRNLTQEELAEKLGVGQPLICRLERGYRYDPRVSHLEKLAIILKCQITDFLDRDAAAEELRQYHNG